MTQSFVWQDRNAIRFNKVDDTTCLEIDVIKTKSRFNVSKNAARQIYGVVEKRSVTNFIKSMSRRDSKFCDKVATRFDLIKLMTRRVSKSMC